MGGIGSVHCIGMCGPLALSLPVVTPNHTSRFISTLLYNVGRISMYAALGALLGVIGSSAAFFGYQQWLSIIMGVLIVLFILFPKKDFTGKNMIAAFFQKIRIRLSNLFAQKKYRSVFFIGLLNGLLPCGLVYLAIAAAISTGSVARSSLFMAGFGAGTLPVMWTIAFFGGIMKANFRQKIRSIYPYLMAVVAALLIIRGLGLNISHISPGIKKQQTVQQQGISCHD